ncbi:hypothetical protein CPC08DRAFT_761139 [Agrocybe pediades]|nr:hypothetical protein CPC08DRAFT_761139 [Agrocybe pediades]
MNTSLPSPVPDSEVTSPLVFLPPSIARELSTAAYIHIGATAVLIWDVLDNLRDDYRIIVLGGRIGLQTCAYVLSRITVLAYALGRSVLMTSPIRDCGRFEAAMNGVLAAYTPIITLGFYLRTYAIYRNNWLVKIVGGLAWLATVGISVTVTQTFTAGHLGPTNYCLEGVQGNLLQALSIILLLFDVLIYIAITYRVYTLFVDRASSAEQKVKLVLGTSLPIFSKAVMQDSQLYFLVIIGMKAFLVYSVYRLKPPTSVMSIICLLVMINILSARLFRTIKMNGECWERPLSPGIGSKMQFADNGSFRATQTPRSVTFPSSDNVATKITGATSVETFEKPL